MQYIKLIISLLLSVVIIIGISTETCIENYSVSIAEPTHDLVDSFPKIEALNLIINTIPKKYTYENFVYDIERLQAVYSDIIKTVKLCDTIDGRAVYDIILGNPQGEDQILIFAAMHAREYITSQIVMRQLCDCIDATNGDDKEYKGISTKELLDNVTIHFIPMSNPDGVAISQMGLDGLKNEELRKYVSSIAVGDYEQWKANANGVDLNRNFDAGWNEFVGSTKPSPDRYKGEYPGSEPESAALITLTENYNFRRTISYHTCGALIYWYYKQEGDILEESSDFAQEISMETGYTLDANYTAVDDAGYKDWAVYKMNIPSLTIEVGNEQGKGIINPVPIDCFDVIWQRNKDVAYATVYNLKFGQN